MRNISLGRRHLVNAYEVEAGIGVIAGNTVWSMPELLECEVLKKSRYINTLTFTFYLQENLLLDVSTSIRGLHQKKLVLLSSSGSWHNGKTLCQESDRMRGSVGSCPHHGSWPVVLPFGCVWPPSGKTLWLSVDHRRLRPVDDMVLLSCVVNDSGFVMFLFVFWMYQYSL